MFTVKSMFTKKIDSTTCLRISNRCLEVIRVLDSLFLARIKSNSEKKSTLKSFFANGTSLYTLMVFMRLG